MTKTGRPTKYSQKLADKICEQLSLGYSIRTVCNPEAMPAISTFYEWLRTYEEFSKQYTRAKQESADAMAEDILDIADDGSNDWMEAKRKDGSTYTALNYENIQRSRLRVDTRKFLMAKMKPKVYGEKLDIVSDGEKIEAGQIVGYVLPEVVSGHKDTD